MGRSRAERQREHVEKAQDKIYEVVAANDMQALRSLFILVDKQFIANIVNMQSTQGTPLYIAAQEGYFEIAQYLIKMGAYFYMGRGSGSVNWDRHITPLNIAVSKGHIEIVKLLLEAGADINCDHTKSDSISYSYDMCMLHSAPPLIIAIQDGNIEMAEFLLQAGANVNFSNTSYPYNKFSPALRCAVAKQNIEIVKLLINAGATTDDESLGIAVKNGYDEIAEFLLQVGASVNGTYFSQRYEKNIHILGIAIENGHDKMIKLLIRAGSEIDRATLDGFSVFLAAAQNIKMIKPLLEEIKAGAKVQNARDLQKLLFPTIQSGDTESLAILLDYNVSIHEYGEVVDRYGMSPRSSTVAAAVKYNHLDICRMLVAHGADFNDEGSDHVPILIATTCGYTEIVEYFVKELKVNINSCDPTGANLLQIAIEAGHTELAKWLIDNEANMYQTRNDGTNSLYSALQQQNYEVLEMLLAAGENLELGEIDKHKFSELMRILKQNIEPFREFITHSQQSKNLLSKLQILKIFADFYTSEEKLEIEAAVQKFKDGCELLELAMIEGIEDFYEDAENCFKEVLGQFKNSAIIYNILALSCYKQHKMQQALEYSDKALELSPKNLIYQTNKVAIYLENGMIAEAAETLFYLAKNYYQNKFININTNINELAAVNNNLIDATSEAFREQIFSRVKNIVLKEDKVSEALRPKIHETGVKLIAKALMYLTDVGQDLADEQSISGAMSDFDRIKNQLDDRFEEMKVEIRGGFVETRRDVAKVSVQLEGDGAYRPEFDPALTGEETAGASSSMDL